MELLTNPNCKHNFEGIKFYGSKDHVISQEPNNDNYIYGQGYITITFQTPVFVSSITSSFYNDGYSHYFNLEISKDCINFSFIHQNLKCSGTSLTPFPKNRLIKKIRWSGYSTSGGKRVEYIYITQIRVIGTLKIRDEMNWINQPILEENIDFLSKFLDDEKKGNPFKTKAIKTLNSKLVLFPCFSKDIQQKKEYFIGERITSFDSTDLFKLLLGVDRVKKNSVYDLFVLFRELKMQTHVYLALKSIEGTLSLDECFDLFKTTVRNEDTDCFIDFQGSAEFKSKINFVLFNKLFDKRNEIKDFKNKDTKEIRKFLMSIFLYGQLDLYEKKDLKSLFPSVTDFPFDFHDLFAKSLKKLYGDEKFTNLDIYTKHGFVCKANAEILVMGSHFYKTVLSGGIECREFFQKSRITLTQEWFTENVIKAHIEYIYTNKMTIKLSLKEYFCIINIAQSSKDEDLMKESLRNLRNNSLEMIKKNTFSVQAKTCLYILEDEKIICDLIKFWVKEGDLNEKKINKWIIESGKEKELSKLKEKMSEMEKLIQNLQKRVSDLEKNKRV